MSAPTTQAGDVRMESAPTSKTKKKKSRKKGGAAHKGEDAQNGTATGTGEGNHDRDTQAQAQDEEQHDEADPDDVDDDEDQARSPTTTSTTQANGTKSHSISSAVALGLARSRSQQGLSASPPPPSDASARLDAAVQERDALRQEVATLKASLDSERAKYAEELQGLQNELDETTESKEHFETQYKNLLGRVNTIKTSLGDRLKADAAKIEDYQSQIAEIEEMNRELQDRNTALTDEVDTLRRDKDAHEAEASSLRSRSTASQQGWIKERDELVSREAYAREEFENAKQAMQDWEVLAMNERSLRENLAEKEGELREQVDSLREAYEKAVSDRDTNGAAVEGLQKALQDMQNLRKTELRESVSTYESRLATLRKQAQDAEAAAASSQAQQEATQKSLDRALPFEKEVKEKNLLIGKLRHEAVTLNEHLTKALRILKKGRPEDNVDRQIITNYFLHFLGLERSDPKKFEALQLIASLLGWSDEQREQAGLARPGATSSSSNSSSLRLPLMPFRRTPSTPSLGAVSDPMLMETSSRSNKESLAELWSDFLAREAATEGGSTPGAAAGTGPASPAALQSPKGGVGLGIGE